MQIINIVGAYTQFSIKKQTGIRGVSFFCVIDNVSTILSLLFYSFKTNVAYEINTQSYVKLPE